MTTNFDPTKAIGRRIELPGSFADPVVIDSVELFEGVAHIRVRTARGEPKDDTVALAELQAALEASDSGLVDWVDPDDLFLLLESSRIRLAFAWDPCFAVSLSGIETLPHQVEAVYERMLPQARLRYLLADDPGAGKTIMAGLLLKELRLRGAVERTLILAPAPLAIQWQDELKSKFDEVFELVDSRLARDQLGGSPWSRFPQCVASMDFAKRDQIAPDLLRQRWDLVIIDEAHKVSMPNRDDPTQRYRLVRELATRTERLLFLTATPHQGNPAQFQNLLSLLDEHAFRSEEAIETLLKADESPWILRRMKEDLRDFEGRRLFVERHAYSETFCLNEQEWILYREVSNYVNLFFSHQVGRKKQNATLVRMVFQRRLASSLRAIRISLERRHDRLRKLLEELDGLPEAERERRLRELANLPLDPELESDDETEQEFDLLAQEAVLVEQYERLADEVAALEPLVQLARQTEARGQESKLDRLFVSLERAELQELEEASGRLLIFTEHRATLDYLRENLEARGYTCCEIHGSMDALARKAAQRDFQKNKQICLATDAAGEGINLQFCHLMINYDMPWNPTRLEQRMGRIHRLKQLKEVHVFNFIALGGPRGPIEQPVVEGRVLDKLLRKLDQIRETIGDRVFDVIGTILRLNNIDLEEVLREAAHNPGLLEDYEADIEAIDEQRLKQYEEATGIALAKREVDLTRIRGRNFESEEKRLMPEYVEDYFCRAAEKTGLRVGKRANPHLLRIDRVPQKFTARDLPAVRRYGPAEPSYPKVSFRKDLLTRPENLDGDLISPGHALYGAVDEVLQLALREARSGTARYVDGLSDVPYRLHFFEVELESAGLGDPGEPPRTVATHAGLVAVQENADGSLEPTSPDVLHDLTAFTGTRLDTEPFSQPVSVQDLRRVERWVRAQRQFKMVQEVREARQQEVEIRRSFLKDSFAASIKVAQKQQMSLQARVLGGEDGARLARDEARKRVEELEAARDHRLRSLDHLAVVRSGRVAHLGSVVVAPPPKPAFPGMQRDPEVEMAAIEFATRYEEAQGWTVTEVFKDYDGSGFDLRSVPAAGAQHGNEVRRIEVKGRARDEGEVHLTPNEWRKARRHGDTYWLYVVWGCKTGRRRLRRIQNPWRQLQAQAREVVEVKGYLIDDAALRRAEGEDWLE